MVPAVGAFRDEPGSGVFATVEGRNLVVGSEAFVRRETGRRRRCPKRPDRKSAPKSGSARPAVPYSACSASRTRCGPTPLPRSRSFTRAGLRTVLLTGDREATARAVAARVGITDVRAGVAPAGKRAVIESLQQGGKARVAMVGDGINDAPALAQADLGIAIGSGSDVAKETGGIVLVSGSLLLVPAAIGLSRATMRCVRQNLFFAFLYNVLAIPLAAFGLLNPLIAAAAMALSDVTVIGNALRLRWAKVD
ncbi:MAG: HAD-IC family P-type ATPase [bacterium]|nr:HAD-IC family P-type ATPase [bacterium]